jgi:hypothetical protein
MMQKNMTGHCLCGAVRFTAESVETDYHACHCEMCRHWNGGPALGAKATGVVFSGQASLGRFASSDWAERGFCRECGASLFYYLTPADLYFIMVGTFDDQMPFVLAKETFIDEKPAGFSFAGHHPRLTKAETLAEYGAS